MEKSPALRLRSASAFAGTLFHEIAHAVRGNSDLTIEFEQDLTDYLGMIASKLLS